MPTAVATLPSSNYLAIAADDIALMGAAAADMGVGGETFLKHDGNTGEYSYGATDEPIEDGEELACDFTSLMRGWTCWKDGKPVEKIFRSYRDGPPPAKHTLPDHGPYEDNDGWQENATLNFRLLRAPFTELTFNASGVSKLNAFGRLIKDFGAQAKTNLGLVPIVSFSSAEFESKAKGARGAKKYAPLLRIVAWETPESLQALEDGSAEDYQDAPPPAEELVAAPRVGRATAGAAVRQAASPPTSRRGKF